MSDWDPDQYARNAAYVSELGVPVLNLLDPQPGERILDLGCGDGALTKELLARGARALGVDASPEMVAAARKMGVDAKCIDGENLPFKAEFNAVFTNAALHWMKHHARVVRGAWNALLNGGRFVGEFGGAGNIEKIVITIDDALQKRGLSVPNPWNFPTADQFKQLLEDTGFRDVHAESFPRPTPLPADLQTWLRTFGKTFLAAVPEPDRKAFMDEVADELRPQLCDAQGNWVIDHVRLRFVALKPANNNQ